MGPDQDPRDVKRVTGASNRFFNLVRCVPANCTVAGRRAGARMKFQVHWCEQRIAARSEYHSRWTE
eukprot:596986-Prymnesium_polylepis.2